MSANPLDVEPPDSSHVSHRSMVGRHQVRMFPWRRIAKASLIVAVLIAVAGFLLLTGKGGVPPLRPEAAQPVSSAPARRPRSFSAAELQPAIDDAALPKSMQPSSEGTTGPRGPVISPVSGQGRAVAPGEPVGAPNSSATAAQQRQDNHDAAQTIPPTRSMMIGASRGTRENQNLPPLPVNAVLNNAAGAPGALVTSVARQAASEQPGARASRLPARTMLIARGAYIPCILETQLISSVPGQAQCILSDNIYSDDGRVLLMEKGSRVVGEYRSSIRQGEARLGVLWQRIKTPTGVTINVESPATDSVGANGVPGHVDSKWIERFGQAILFSLVQDVVRGNVGTKNQAEATGSSTRFYPQSTFQSGESLAKSMVDANANLQPVLYLNRGTRLMIFVNRDLHFDNVYSMMPTEAENDSKK